VRNVTGTPVLVTRRLPAGAMEQLAGLDVELWPEQTTMPRQDLLRAASGKHALVTLLTERVDDELLDAAGEQLLVVANYAVGFDNIDVEACTHHGVMASNTPDVLTETTADMTWALMLAAARRVAEGDRFLRTGEAWVWGPEMMLGQDIHHKTLGVVGFGRIGQAVARRASGFEMEVLWHDPLIPAGVALPGRRVAGLEELLGASDFVSLHVNLSDETRHLMNAERLRQMRPTAVLVNAARGPVIDEAALAEALDNGVIFAAGLDVYEREPEVHPGLRANARVVLAPHLGSATVDTRLAMGMVATSNVLAALRGERPPTLVNPAVWDAPNRRRPRGAR
jgi:glyoxylate reductase